MESYSNKPESKGSETHKKVVFEPMRIGPISTLEEMDIKVLKFQNKKLAMVQWALFLILSFFMNILFYSCFNF